MLVVGVGVTGSLGTSWVSWFLAGILLLAGVQVFWLISGGMEFSGCKEMTGVGLKGWIPPLKGRK